MQLLLSEYTRKENKLLWGLIMLFEATYNAIKRKIIVIGLLGTTKLIIRRFIDKLFKRENVLFYVDVSTYSLNPQEIAKDIVPREIERFEDLSVRDIEAIRNYAGKKYLEECRSRFANNWRLFLGYVNDHVAGGCWAATNSSNLRTKVVPLLDGDVALIDGWTIPEFRGRNVYPFIMSYIVTEFRDRNFKRAFGYAPKWNRPSLKGCRTMGFRDFIIYEEYRIFGREVIMWKPFSEKPVSFE